MNNPTIKFFQINKTQITLYQQPYLEVRVVYFITLKLKFLRSDFSQIKVLELLLKLANNKK